MMFSLITNTVFFTQPSFHLLGMERGTLFYSCHRVKTSLIKINTCLKGHTVSRKILVYMNEWMLYTLLVMHLGGVSRDMNIC